jgi:hypothetical protein
MGPATGGHKSGVVRFEGLGSGVRITRPDVRVVTLRCIMIDMIDLNG